MKINEFELLTLYKYGFIPTYLMEGWKKRHGDIHPLEDLHRTVKYSVFCCLMAYACLVFWGISYIRISGTLDHISEIRISLLVVVAGTTCFALLAIRLFPGYRFVRNLRNLHDSTGFGMHDFLMTSDKGMQRVAGIILGRYGHSVETAEIEFGRDSIEAEAYRDIFRKQHGFFLDFDLVPEKWGSFFENSTPTKQKVPSTKEGKW